MIYEPSQKNTEAFSKAVDILPDTLASDDLAAFFYGVMRAYELDEDCRNTIALALLMQGKIATDEEPTLEFDDPKLAAMFKSGTA